MLRRRTKVDGLAPVPWRTCFPVSGRLIRLRSKEMPQLVVSAERQFGPRSTEDKVRRGSLRLVYRCILRLFYRRRGGWLGKVLRTAIELLLGGIGVQQFGVRLGHSDGCPWGKPWLLDEIVVILPINVQRQSYRMLQARPCRIRGTRQGSLLSRSPSAWLCQGHWAACAVVCSFASRAHRQREFVSESPYSHCPSILKGKGVIRVSSEQSNTAEYNRQSFLNPHSTYR